MNNEVENIKKNIVEFFKSRKCKFVFVLGSLVSTERFNDQSDIDIAAYMEEEVDSFELYSDLSNYLNTDRNIDLILMNKADIIIISQILTNGELLINNDKLYLINYRAKKMSEYIDFKRSRKIIEDKILEN
ncbi:MAG: hypothetical protein KDD58_00315 [Bdellovibrionales bacterium]|nr:hypothetical protein [Bdellovibrionales bacterium]